MKKGGGASMNFNEILSTLNSLFLGDVWNQLGIKIQKQNEYSKLKQKINELAKRYKTSFEQLDLREEFDWDGLNQFLKEQMGTAQDNMLLGSIYLHEHYQRDWAWSNFLRRAQEKARANTPESRQAVYQYVKLFREIVIEFFLKQIDTKNLILSGHVEDNILNRIDALLDQYHREVIEEISYHGSFAQFLDNIQMPEDLDKPLHYRNCFLHFQGRKQELEILRQFLKCEDSVKWMAIVGSSGTGKSKLIYHFVKEAEADPDWKICWLSTSQVKRLSDYTVDLRYRCGILLIIDYAGESAKQIGSWLEQANGNKSRPKKIRLILVEREIIHGSFDPAKLQPQWYQDLLGNSTQARIIKQLCYKPFTDTFALKLSALNDAELIGMIVDYAKITSRRVLSAAEQEIVLQWAKEIDRKYSQPRPLVVLMTTDAVLAGKTGKQWSVEKLLEYILNRDEQHWKTVICENNSDLYRAVLDVLAYATATGGWQLMEDLARPLKERIEQLRSLDASKLETLISALNQNSTVSQLLPLEPDLIGEYFVLRRWSEQKYNRFGLATLFSLLWQKPFEFAIFLDRCINDYLKSREFQWLFQNSMEILQPIEEFPLAILYFAMLLVNLSSKQQLEEATEAINRLRDLSDSHKDSLEITLEYARGLVNLSNKQQLEEATETTNQLRDLSESHKDSQEIAWAYAKGLLNLSNKQQLEESTETINRLRDLSESHKDSLEIALEYAKGLFNLSNKQQLEESTETINRLRDLSESHKDSLEIALEYAKGLFNLSNKQQLEEVTETINRLRDLSESYKDSLEIALEYAKELVNLSSKQQLEEATETINRLRDLSESHKDSLEIVSVYAKGLVNLSNKQQLEEATETINQLRDLSESHKDSLEIVSVYAKGLVNLSNKQQLEESTETINQLRDLSESYKDSLEIALVFAKGLVNLSCDQELKEATETINQLRDLSESHKDSLEFALEYANGLINLSYKQQPEEADNTVKRLCDLLEKYPDLSEFLENDKGLEIT